MKREAGRVLPISALVLLAAVIILITWGCREDDPATPPSVTTSGVSDIGSETAVSGGEVVNDGGAPVTSRGVVWGVTQDPDIDNGDKFTVDGMGTGTFTSTITGLQPATTYYIRAYAVNREGTAYGGQKSFETEGTMATVTTAEVNEITTSTAISGGEVTNDGGMEVTARGVVWSSSENPDIIINDGFTEDGAGTGLFTSNLEDLEPSTTYFLRAYATNSEGTAYGNELQFTTDAALAVVTTGEISDVTFGSAMGGGEVTDDGGDPVTARGVVWNRTGNPTTDDNYTVDGAGTGSFTSTITGLDPGNTYFVRAYATNSQGTSYGEEAGFTTPQANAIFVSPLGSDTNDGLPSSPMRSIQAAINKADQEDKDLYIAAGTYTSGTISLKNGVSLYGGFHPETWHISKNNIVNIVHDGTVVSGRITAIEGVDITSSTFLQYLTIETPNAHGNGVSNYAVHLVNSGGLIVIENSITAGDGSDGAAGTDGNDGRDGGDGENGTPGSGDNDVNAWGGSGGSSAVGRLGGSGGRGRYGNNPGNNGMAGMLAGSGGGQGGAGGPATGCFGDGDGQHGYTGAPGSNGPNGSGGSGGSLAANFWLSAPGISGSNGTHGHGGGGGGGGGGQGGIFCINGTGNGGGGGGGGGEAGHPGTGGEGGGGSFGIFVVNSNGVQITDNEITSGNGGRGGTGGAGGCPGAGGKRGLGANQYADEVGVGGHGGDGGNGGRGGHGGGGAGGPSYAVYRSNTIVNLANNTLINGSGGAGGSATSRWCPIGGTLAGNSGEAGSSGNVN